ncbi:unnamed protein product [Natator depressus]
MWHVPGEDGETCNFWEVVLSGSFSEQGDQQRQCCNHGGVLTQKGTIGSHEGVLEGLQDCHPHSHLPAAGEQNPARNLNEERVTMHLDCHKPSCRVQKLCSKRTTLTPCCFKKNHKKLNPFCSSQQTGSLKGKEHFSL